MSVPDHQLEPPPVAFACPGCDGEAASWAVADAFEDLTDGRNFPTEAVRDFLAEFETAIKDMREFACDRATEARKRNDWNWCNRHAPTEDDGA